MFKKNSKKSEIFDYIWYLLTITLLLAFSISGLFYWQERSEHISNDRISNYHNTSLHNLDIIHIEILNLKIPHTAQNTSNSKHIIDQAISNLTETQKIYDDIDLEYLTKQLEKNIKILSSLHPKDNEKNLKAIKSEHLDAITLTTKQLTKLHKIKALSLYEKSKSDDKFNIILVASTSTILATLYLIVVLKTKKKIQHIVQSQKDSENSLRDEKKLIHTTLNSIGDAVITTDKEGKITLLNPIAEKLSGWSNDEAQGKYINNIFKIIDTTTRYDLENPVEKVLKHNKIVYLSNNATLISRDGTEYHISDSAAPILDSKKTILGTVLVFNNITEQYILRRESENSKHRLESIMNNSPEIIYVNNIAGKLTYVNNMFEKAFNTKFEKTLNKSLSDLIPDESAQAIEANEKKVLELPGAHEFEENIFINNIVRTFMSTKFPIYNNLGIIEGVCSISTDITERIDREKHQRQAQKMESLGKLTGGIAHDYNNILGIITGYTDLLIEQLNDKPELKKFATEIGRASDRGAKLTKKLLSFTRKKQAQQSTLDINKVLLQQQELLEKTLTSRIKLKMDLDRKLWTVHLDSGDLEDAIINLCINSMHAIDGTGTIQIRTRNEHINTADAAFIKLSPGDYVLLSITDTGCGMDDEIKENIFDPFFTTKGERGTGLGLSQVYGFIERSKGAIQVYSEPDKGCQMVLYFPRHYQQNKTTGGDSIEADIPNKHGNETVLIVDDEPSLLSLTHEILSMHGYRTLCAESARQALDILKQEDIKLVISDIIMPEMDGYELAAIIQDKYPSIIIQLCSGYSDERNIGMVDRQLQSNILHKPFHTRTLLNTVEKLLNSD